MITPKQEAISTETKSGTGGRFYLFLNHRQASRLGHVGWGFTLGDGRTCMFGSTDHLIRHRWWNLWAWVNYMYVAPGDHTDFWFGYGDESEMYRAMSHSRSHIWYHECKVVVVEDARPGAAEALALSMERAGWAALSNNCVQQTHDIATAYGVGDAIPDPRRNSLFLVPRLWFPAVTGEHVMLR
ncbi:MAG: hypothetical protein AB7W16_22780 [Candidatus Obscuribacterales bacterium]